MQAVNLFEVESSFKDFDVCMQEPELVQQKEVSPSEALLGPNTGKGSIKPSLFQLLPSALV